MAVNHIALNPTATHAGLVKGPVSSLQAAVRSLGDTIGTLGLMIDGDGSEAAHFVYMADKIGAQTAADAQAVWAELNSLYSKVSGNGQVADVNAAINQAANKFR